MVINVPDRITKKIGNVTKYLTNVVAKHIPCLTCYFDISKIGCLIAFKAQTQEGSAEFVNFVYEDETAHNIKCLP